MCLRAFFFLRWSLMLLLLLFKAEPTSVRRTEGLDPYRCLINVRSSRETEDVCGACPDFYSSPQRTLSARRAPLCCFIAQQALKNTPTTSRFRPASIPPTPRFIWRESGPLFTRVCLRVAHMSQHRTREVWQRVRLKGNRSRSTWGQGAFSASSLGVN